MHNEVKMLLSIYDSHFFGSLNIPLQVQVLLKNWHQGEYRDPLSQVSSLDMRQPKVFTDKLEVYFSYWFDPKNVLWRENCFIIESCNVAFAFYPFMSTDKLITEAIAKTNHEK